jgi:CheY-like chemotaxis protein
MMDPSVPAFIYAEDDPDDRLLAEMAHRESTAGGLLRFVADGEEALAYLRHPRGETGTEHGRREVVLLDLNMPGMDGRETLRVIRADASLRRIPVVILTTSASREDVRASYDAGANAYIVKPRDFASLVRIFSVLSTFWFEISSLPKEAPR